MVVTETLNVLFPVMACLVIILVIFAQLRRTIENYKFRIDELEHGRRIITSSLEALQHEVASHNYESLEQGPIISSSETTPEVLRELLQIEENLKIKKKRK